MWKWLKRFVRKFKKCAEEAHKLRAEYESSEYGMLESILNDWEVW